MGEDFHSAHLNRYPFAFVTQSIARSRTARLPSRPRGGNTRAGARLTASQSPPHRAQSRVTRYERTRRSQWPTIKGELRWQAEPASAGRSSSTWSLTTRRVENCWTGQAVREMDHITKAALSVSNKDQLHVAVQVDFRTLPGVWRRVIGETTFVRPESNAADPATLYGFFEWAANECPAEHYLLIFWGHSRGSVRNVRRLRPLRLHGADPDARRARRRAQGGQAVAGERRGYRRVQGLLHGDARDRL